MRTRESAITNARKTVSLPFFVFRYKKSGRWSWASEQSTLGDFCEKILGLGKDEATLELDGRVHVGFDREPIVLTQIQRVAHEG